MARFGIIEVEDDSLVTGRVVRWARITFIIGGDSGLRMFQSPACRWLQRDRRS
jgi:hypothetical protein